MKGKEKRTRSTASGYQLSGKGASFFRFVLFGRQAEQDQSVVGTEYVKFSDMS
jgi:hypothetical protein